jgi:hypothetical protein
MTPLTSFLEDLRMEQKTEHRMGGRKWDKLLTDFQKKVRSAKRIGPDAREDLSAPWPLSPTSFKTRAWDRLCDGLGDTN